MLVHCLPGDAKMGSGYLTNVAWVPFDLLQDKTPYIFTARADPGHLEVRSPIRLSTLGCRLATLRVSIDNHNPRIVNHVIAYRPADHALTRAPRLVSWWV